MFRENNIDAERVNYFNEPFTVEKLTELIKKTGSKPFDFLRKGEAVFKELNLTKDSPDADIINSLIEHPNLLQRPIVEVGERAVLARPIEKVRELLNL